MYVGVGERTERDRKNAIVEGSGNLTIWGSLMHTDNAQYTGLWHFCLHRKCDCCGQDRTCILRACRHAEKTQFPPRPNITLMGRRHALPWRRNFLSSNTSFSVEGANIGKGSSLQHYFLAIALQYQSSHLLHISSQYCNLQTMIKPKTRGQHMIKLQNGYNVKK